VIALEPPEVGRSDGTVRLRPVGDDDAEPLAACACERGQLEGIWVPASLRREPLEQPGIGVVERYIRSAGPLG
jgi:hypothetical protein